MKCKTIIKWRGTQFPLLTYTSTMSAWSFSLPAGKAGSCIFSTEQKKSTICASCYAQINRYNMPNVLDSQWKRFLWLKENLGDNFDQTVEIFISSIGQHATNNYFRVHDSGDFFSVEYVNLWLKIAQELDTVQFWFPTRNYLAKNKNWQDALGELNDLPNVVIRPSALEFNSPPPKVPYLSLGTSVITSDNIEIADSICPKTLNGGSCESNHCRSCWGNDKTVSYLVHGYVGSSKVPIITEKIINLRISAKNANIKKYSKP